MLAPTQELLDAFKKQRGSWADFEQSFMALMNSRAIESALDPADFQASTALPVARQLLSTVMAVWFASTSLDTGPADDDPPLTRSSSTA